VLRITGIISFREIVFTLLPSFAPMPKLYEYFGLVVMFYSNEHDPIHVHGKYQNMESKAEILIENGIISLVRIVGMKGKRPLEGKELNKFRMLVDLYKNDIVNKWVEFFIYNKNFSPITITKELK